MVPVAPRSSSIGQRDECSLLRFLATRARRLQDDGVLSGECFRALKRSLGQLRLASMLQALRRRRSPFYHMLIRAHLHPLPVLVHGETPSTPALTPPPSLPQQFPPSASMRFIISRRSCFRSLSSRGKSPRSSSWAGSSGTSPGLRTNLGAQKKPRPRLLFL